MKQHITKEQWDELSYKQMEIVLPRTSNLEFSYKSITIGQMIEFLGEDVNKANIIIYKNDDVKLDWKNLCNLLWEAVKNKLI